MMCEMHAPPTRVCILKQSPDDRLLWIIFKASAGHAFVNFPPTEQLVQVNSAFAITAQKTQGKLPARIVNLTGCRGSESPYAMVSRATSLNGNPYPVFQGQDLVSPKRGLRAEFRRLKTSCSEDYSDT
jgi:hypothetical protein